MAFPGESWRSSMTTFHGSSLAAIISADCPAKWSFIAVVDSQNSFVELTA